MTLSRFDEQTTSAFTTAKLKCFGTLGSLINPTSETRSMRVLHKVAYRKCLGASLLDELKLEKQNLERDRRQQRGTVRAPELRLEIIELAKSIVILEKDIVSYQEAADKAKRCGDFYAHQKTLDRLKYRLPLEKKKLRRFRTELGKLNQPTATHESPKSCDSDELQEARTRDQSIQRESRDQWKRDRRLKPNWDNTKRDRKQQVRRLSRLSCELSREYVEPLTAADYVDDQEPDRDGAYDDLHIVTDVGIFCHDDWHSAKAYERALKRRRLDDSAEKYGKDIQRLNKAIVQFSDHIELLAERHNTGFWDVSKDGRRQRSAPRRARGEYDRVG